jgi:hypothetical protein
MNTKVKKYKEVLKSIEQYEKYVNPNEKQKMRSALVYKCFNENLEFEEVFGCETERQCATKIISELFKDSIPVEIKTEAYAVKTVKGYYPDEFIYHTVYQNVSIRFYEDTVKILGNRTYSEIMELAETGKIVLTDFQLGSTEKRPDSSTSSTLYSKPSSDNFLSSKNGLLNYCVKNDKVFEKTKETIKAFAKDYIKNAEQENAFEM